MPVLFFIQGGTFPEPAGTFVVPGGFTPGGGFVPGTVPTPGGFTPGTGLVPGLFFIHGGAFPVVGAPPGGLPVAPPGFTKGGG